MKLLRVLIGGLLLVFAAMGAVLWYVAQHENELVNLILAQVGERTGLLVETSGIRLGLGTRLVVVLERARVIVDRRETARLGAMRAVFSYGAILHRTGLPLFALVLNRGTISLGREPSGPPASASMANRLGVLSRYLDKMSDVARRVELEDITFLGPDQRPLAEHVTGSAYRQHYRHGTWPWIVNFDAGIPQGLMAGARFSGDLQLGRTALNPSILAQGQIRFWQISLHRLKLEGLRTSARLDGNLYLTLSADAQATGDFTLTMRDLLVDGPAVRTPLKFGRLWWRGDYHLSQIRGELSKLELYGENRRILEGSTTISNPYSSRRAITFSATGITLKLTDIPKWLRSLQSVPPKVLNFADRIRSGSLTVNQVGLKNPEPLEGLRLPMLARKLEFNAALTGFSFVQPPQNKLPSVYEFDAQVNYSNPIVRIIQATGQIGASTISDMSLELNLSKAPDGINYRLKVDSWLDVGEFYDAATDLIRASQPGIQAQLLWVHGHSSIQLQAKGAIERLRAEIPRDYLITAGLGDVQFELKNSPSAIWLNSGSILLEPGRISLKRVIGVPLAQPGNIAVNGAIVPQQVPSPRVARKTAGQGQSGPQFRDLSVEIHQLASDKWVPLLVNPAEIAVSGPIGGKLVANSQPGVGPIVVGKLTLDHGSVQPGFLRNPMVVTHSATLVLDGKGLILDLPASSLEGEPLDFRLAVADLNHPQVRIDASIARIDFEVMRFIRLPWSPSTPPVFFPVPVAGHIDAQAGNFDKLAMNQISTDFYHDSQNWRVSNFRASAFNGAIALRISGRQRDDWIDIKGDIRHMDAGPLFLLSGNTREPPILGKLAATGDLWANTNTDFFRTLAGSVSITMTDGTLNRFTLMKRILSLVNLRNYLTAQFPDPRKSGVPFKTLDADFRGERGVFYTDNLRLNGPVMDITARGSIDFADNTMDMEIDLLALQTVNWLINNIPLIGRNLSGATKHLVGAYFQVRGPTDHPAIWPKPITSVAEFVFRTLTLPINIIAPNTIQ